MYLKYKTSDTWDFMATLENLSLSRFSLLPNLKGCHALCTVESVGGHNSVPQNVHQKRLTQVTKKKKTKKTKKTKSLTKLSVK